MKVAVKVLFDLFTTWRIQGIDTGVGSQTITAKVFVRVC
jgi:hypothetical protein